MKVSQKIRVPPNNLPVPFSTFIGRDREIEEVKRLLVSQRLVTLTGTGGSGKTRLALRVAEELSGEFEHRIWFVELAAVKIFGCAESVRAPIGSVIDPADQPEYARIISGLQSVLGIDAFAEAWAEGKSMRLKDVIELALSGSEAKAESQSTEKEKYGGLTEREREVAVWIAQGKSNREIADAMTVGIKTIETYVTRILNKLGFDWRVQVATWAMKKKLVSSQNAGDPSS